MGAVLAVVKLPKKSGIPADAVQNTFAFAVAAAAPTSAELDAITAALTNFYNTSHTFAAVTGTVAGLLSASLSTTAGAATISFYDINSHMDGTPHGSPVRVDTWTLGAVGGDSLPDEVAVCLSIHAAYGTDVEFAPGARPRSRDRGRIFIGPLSLAGLGTDATTNEPNVSANMRSRIAGAAVALRDDTATDWSVWSRSKADLLHVVGGWVDSAFDTQRRRGNEALVRSTW